MNSDTIFAQIFGESEFQVGVDGVQTFILQFVGVDFVENTDPAAFLPQIDQHSGTVFGDHPQSGLELRAAVTAQGTENISGETFAVDTNQNIFL